MKSTAAALIVLCYAATPGLAETAKPPCNPGQFGDRCVQARQDQLDRDLFGKPLPDTARASRSAAGMWSEAPRSMPWLRR